MSDNIKAIVIRGDFTQQEFDELKRFAELTGATRRPAPFAIVAVDPTEATSFEDADRLLRQAVNAAVADLARGMTLCRKCGQGEACSTECRGSKRA